MQLLNIYSILFTFSVLNTEAVRAKDCNFSQLLNIEAMLVTKLVSKFEISKLINDSQLLNILVISFTLVVTKSDKSKLDNLVQLINIDSIFVTEQVSKFFITKDSKAQ